MNFGKKVQSIYDNKSENNNTFNFNNKNNS